MSRKKRSGLSKSLYWLLALAMVFSLIPGLSAPVFAEDAAGTATEGAFTALAAPESILVSPMDVNIVLGGTQQFTATVIGTDADEGITWRLEGNTDAATSIDASGLLTVSNIEGAATLKVIAASTNFPDVYASATVTVEDLPFSLNLSKNDLLLHYIFNTNEKGVSNDYVRDYSPMGNHSTIGGSPTASQWSANGFTFSSTQNQNYIMLPWSANLVNPRMTLVIGLTRTGSQSGNGSLFSGKTGWSSNGFWINTSGNPAPYISHNGGTGGNLGSPNGSYTSVFPTNQRVEFAYSVDARTAAATGFAMLNGVKQPNASINQAAITPITSGSYGYSIGRNSWGDEGLMNARMDKYMIFNRNLTEAEVQEVYQGRLDPHKAALNDAVIAAIGRNADYYTPASLDNLRSARRAAVLVLKNRTATDVEINAALAALDLAVRSLVAVPNIVNSVSISPDTASINLANSQQFTATVVTGDDSIPKTVEWSVNSAISTISQDGLLSIPVTETADTLIVTVTSTIDYAKYATASITVTANPTIVEIGVSPKVAEVRKGESQAFTAALTTVGGPDESVAWSVDSTVSTIDGNGLLNVAANETKALLTVTAASVFDPEKYDTAKVSTYAITSVDITPPAKNPQKGRSRIFTAAVTGDGVPESAKGVTWEVIGAQSAQTAISALGSLYVGMDETATLLVIKATSVKDSTKSSFVYMPVDPYTEEPLVNANGYFNSFARDPVTGSTYANNVAISGWESLGTWRTQTGGTAAPTLSNNTGWSQSAPSQIFTAAERVYIGNYTTYYRNTSTNNLPGGDIVTYNGGKYADIDYTVGIRLNTGATTGGIVFRYEDEQNYYYLKTATTGNRFALGKVVNGVDTVLRSATSPTVAAGTWYNLRVILKGNTITVQRNTAAYWNVRAQSAITTIWNNVELDAGQSFKQGRCGLWSLGGNANVLFNLVGIGNLDFNYTLSNSTFTMVNGAQGHLKSLRVNNGNLTNFDFMSNEDQIRVEMGLNKYLGELKFRYSVDGGSLRTANTGTSDDIRKIDFDDQSEKIVVDYTSQPSANSTGIRDFTVQEAYSVGTDLESGDYVKFEINLKNTGTQNIEFQDIALPISWNVHWQADSPYENYAAHASNYVSYHSSYIELERASGGGDKVILIPDSSTDAKLEYRRYYSTQDYVMNMPEEFFIYSKAIGASTSNNWDQGYLPHTSLVLAPGEEKTFAFKIFKTSDYLGINDILAQQGLIAPSVNPGMVTPINVVTEVDLRTIKNIEQVVDLTPAPPTPAVLDESKRAVITRNAAKSDGEHNVYNIQFQKLGRNDITVIYDGGKKTVLQFWVTEDLKDAIQRRADFLIDELWLSDAKQQEILGGSGSATLKTFVQKHPYSFLEFNNVNGTAGLHSGNSFYCSNNDYEQYYDGPDFLAAKNIYYPIQREVSALDTYLVDLVYEKQVNGFGTQYEGYLATRCCDNNAGGSGGWSYGNDPVNRVQRWFNYPRMYNMFFSMYQIAKRYPDLEMKHDAVWYLRVAGIIARVGAQNSGSTGLMGEQTVYDLYQALLAEGETTLANQVNTQSVSKATRVYNQAYPFGSEFSVDNTGEEGGYFNLRNFYNGTETNRTNKMKVIADKTMAWIGKTPVWYLQTTGRPMGNDWWMFQYAVGLQAKAYEDWYFNYADEKVTDYYGNGQYSQDVWRMVYPAKMSPFVHILSGQPEFNIGPASGSLANTNQAVDGRGVKGSVWGNYMPTRPYDWNNGFPYSTSAECDISLWSGLQLLSADVVPNDPSFGATGYGAQVADTGDAYEVTPQDGLYRRLNVVGDRFQAEFINDRYTFASVGKSYDDVSFSLENATGTAHTGVVTIRGLAEGEYNIRVNDLLLDTVEVTDSNAFTEAAYAIGTGNAVLRIVEVGLDDTIDDDRIISVAVTPASTYAVKGGTTAFDPVVTMINAEGLLAGTVTWSVTGGTSAGTSISANGVLSVGADETASALTVTAVSTDDPTKFGSATANLYTIDDVAITPPADPTVIKGKSLQLSATVSHENAPSNLQGVVWSVEGNQNVGTYINSTGLLTIAVGEKASSVTVKATAAGDPSKYETIVIPLASRPPVTADNVQLDYRFDGTLGEGGALKDYSPDANNTVIAGTIGSNSWTSDGFAFASGNNIKLDSSVQLVGSEMTLVFKIKRTGNMGTASLFWGKNASDWAGNGLWINTADGLTIYHDGAAAVLSLGTTVDALFPLNQWVEVAYSIDTTESPAKGILMVNGVKRNVDIPADAEITAPTAAYNSIGISGYDNEPLTNATLGKYLVFNRALTEEELADVYSGDLPVYDPPIALYLQLVYDIWGELDDYELFTKGPVWNAYVEARENAETILANPENYSQNKVDAAAAALNDAAQAVIDPDSFVYTDELVAYIEAAEEILDDEDTYITSVIAPLTAALAEAKTALAERLSQDDIDAAVTALENVLTIVYPRGDLLKVATLAAYARTLTPGNFTDASWAAVDAALEACDEVVSRGTNASDQACDFVYAKLYEAIGNLVIKGPPLNYAALDAAITRAQAILAESNKYVASSISGLPAALASAQDVRTNATTQSQLNAAALALSRENAKARLKADLSDLEDILGLISSFDFTPYTDGSVNSVTGLLPVAKQMTEESEQSEINQMVRDLVAAMKALALKPGQTAPPQPSLPVSGGGSAGTQEAAVVIPPDSAINPTSPSQGANSGSGADSGSSNGNLPTPGGNVIDESETPLSAGGTGIPTPLLIAGAILGLIALCWIFFLLGKRRRKEDEQQA